MPDAPNDEPTWGQTFVKVLDGVRNVNETVNRSTFGRVFRLKDSGHPNALEDANFTTEIRAGLTTFATMAYIIAVNASILADSGGPCHCELPLVDNKCQNDDVYSKCALEVHRDYITATAALTGLASILFGFLTNLPVALGPGMGLNAYFTYQVVGVKGTGPVPYGLALTAVFVEGFIFMFLAITGMRQWLVKIIPGTIKTASGVGIGLFLTLIGMSYNSGLGLVTPGTATPLAIGGCPPEALSSSNGVCTSDAMTSPKMWLGVCGGVLTAFLMAFRVKAAIVIGIAFVTVLSWPRNTSVTVFPSSEEGQNRFDFFRQVVAFSPIQHILGAQQWNLSGAQGTHFVIALFTFLYVDIVDCTATLYSMASFCNKTRRSDGDFPRSTIAYCTDAACISIGSLLGCSPVTAFVESGSGIAEGGRTGLTAIVAGICFLISIFFSPIFASIPPWATGATLILVGCLMIRQVTSVNWRYIGDAIPSFVTIVFIPFSYSVAYGLLGGVLIYTVLNTLIWVVIWASGGRIEPREYDLKEYWTWKPAGEKPWLFRVFSKGRIWNDHRKMSTHEHMALDGDNDSNFPMHEGRLGSATTSSEEKGVECISTPPRAMTATHRV